MGRTMDIAALAKLAAGNHRHFESFHWHEEPEDSENWCLVYTNNRDSGLLDQSNADAIEKILKPHLGKDILQHRASHWGHGWVDGYSIRVYRNGQITDAFRKWCDLDAALQDYPVLDEEDYSLREYEATLANIQDQGEQFILDEAPEDWPKEVFSWLWVHDQRELDNVDGQGGYPSKEAIRKCLEALAYIQGEP